MTEWVAFPASSALLPLPPLGFTACAFAVPWQTPSQLEVPFDLQEFCSFIHVTWEMHLVYTELFPSDLHVSLIYLPLKSLLCSTISASFPLSSFTPLAPTLRCCPLQTRAEGSGASVGQASCRSSRGQNRHLPSRWSSLALPLSIPFQGLCCGPFLLFTKPPPDPLNCR